MDFTAPLKIEQPFRCSAKNFFLTYDNCPLQKETFLACLSETIHADFNGFCVTREFHISGKQHIHCYLRFPYKKNIKSKNAFDITHEVLGDYHCNIQAVRSIASVLSYIQKDDTAPLTNLTQDELKGLSAWEIIHKCDSKNFIETVAKFEPRALYINHSNILAALEWKKSLESNAPSFVSPYPLSSFNIPQSLANWKLQIGKNQRCVLLIIIGPPNIGKTSMVRSLGSHVYIRGMWNMKKFVNQKYDYVVLDDMDTTTFNPLFYRSILLGDGEQDCSDKYMKKHTIISHGKPCVLLTNYEEMLEKFIGPSWSGCIDILRLNSPCFTV
jgi:hypothetical protein